MRITRNTAVCVIFAALLTIQTAAHAGVEIGSDPYAPSVKIRVKKTKPSSGHSHGQRHGGHGTGSTDIVTSTCGFAGRFASCFPEFASEPKSGGGGVIFTAGMARRAVAEIPMPALTLHVQPQGPTLVNVDTIFWADPAPFATSITLLGHSIDIKATPTAFTWQHGDGSSQTTSDAGAPYPAKDITHRYFQSASSLPARVDTTYAVRYSIDGGGWDDLGQDLTATGPATPIDVKEAAPVLVR